MVRRKGKRAGREKEARIKREDVAELLLLLLLALILLMVMIKHYEIL